MQDLKGLFCRDLFSFLNYWLISFLALPPTDGAMLRTALNISSFSDCKYIKS